MSGRTVVFVEPPYVCWDRRMDRVRQGEEDIPGVGTLVLAAVARQAGHRVHVVDGKRSGTSIDAVARRVAALAPDHVGIGATTISVTNAGRIAAELKRMVPQAVITIGGPHVSAVPERTLETFAAFDYGVAGEGERSYLELIARLDAGASPRDVPGLVYRTGDGVRANPRAAWLDGDELDRLPDPAWDLVPDFPLRFAPNVFNYRHTPVASLVTSRGCPFSCTFCDRSTSGRRGRFHSVESVVAMCGKLEAMGVRHILFYDDLFTVNRPRVVALCERFLREGFRFTWSCNSHPNLLDADTLRLMRRAGCWQIAYGIESGSQRVLDVVKHEVKLPRMLETLRLTRAAGIRVKGLLMMGHPTEGEDSLADTVRFLKTAPIDLAQITKFAPYPGTPAYPTIRDHGAFDEDWERMNAMNWLFVPTGLTPEILERYFRAAYKTFYSRPDVLWRLGRMLLGEPRFLRRFATYVTVGVRDWLTTPDGGAGVAVAVVSVTTAALVPAYQAAATIGAVVEGTRRVLPRVLVVDDGSADDTSARARAAGAEVLRLEPNQGKGAALAAGLRHLASAGVERALTLDADGQHLPDQIPVILAASDAAPGAIVVGVRRKEGSKIRRINLVGNRLADVFMRRIAGRSLPDTQSGFRVYPVTATLALGTRGTRYDFETEVLLRAARRGMDVRGVEVEVYYPPVAERVSHYRPWVDTWRIIRTVLRALRAGA